MTISRLASSALRGQPQSNVLSASVTPTTATLPNGTVCDVYSFIDTVNSGSITFAAPTAISVLIAAGGGAGAPFIGGMSEHCGGAGGAGGLIIADVAVYAQTYTITVGAGGTNASPTGVDSIAFGLTAKGGGQGGNQAGSTGGSGGGGGGYAGTFAGAGSNVTGGIGLPLQGYGGGNGASGGGQHGGGGGGAGGLGANNSAGAGYSSSITGSAVTYCAGGIPGGNSAGAANTGNGGNSSTSQTTRYAGGSGIVIVRVPRNY